MGARREQPTTVDYSNDSTPSTNLSGFKDARPFAAALTRCATRCRPSRWTPILKDSKMDLATSDEQVPRVGRIERVQARKQIQLG